MTRKQFLSTVNGELHGFLSDGFRYIGDCFDDRELCRVYVFRHNRNGSKLVVRIFDDIAFFYRNGKLVNTIS